MPYDTGCSTEEIEAFAADLAGVVAGLQALARQIEPDFLRLGDTLQTILDKVDTLHREVSKALTLIAPGGGKTGILDRIERYERGLAIRFRANAALLQTCLKRTRESSAHLAKMEQVSTSFQSNSARMNTIGIYFSIEISRSAEAARVFTSFAEEIRVVFAEINRLVEDIRREAKRGETEQSNALQNLELDYRSVAEDSQKIIEDGYETIRRVSQVSMEMLERITGYFTALERNIARILTALQIGDITRQQIEHIVSGLRDIPVTHNGFSPPSAGVCYKAAALQLAQLRHVRIEIGEAGATIRDATEQIAVVLDVLTKDVEELMSGVRNRAGVSHWADEMTEELHRILAIDQAGRNIAERTFSTMTRTAEASQRLRHQVAGISATNRRLRFEAYNARILSMRLGEEGRALTTLAKEVSDLSGATHQYLNSVSDTIESITRLVGEDGQSDSGKDHPEGRREGETGLGQIDLDQLEEEIRSFVTLTSEACQSARSLLENAQQIQGGLETIETVTQQVDKAVSVLGSATAAIAVAAGTDAVEEWEQAEAHADRYTMEAERRIHQQLLNMAKGAELPTTGPSTSNLPTSIHRAPPITPDDLGDNVDLF